MDTVGIVGPGPRFGALSQLLDRGDTEVKWTDLDGGESVDEPPAGTAERIDPEALKRIHLVFVCVPLHRMTNAARRIGEYLSGRHVLVHLGRTLVRDSLEPISELLTRETPTRRVGFVSGPMCSSDVEAGRGGAAVCASAFPEVIDMVDGALSSDSFRIYRNADVVGAEAAATYTRVIALVGGMASELDLGRSATATLFARGLAETARFVEDFGGEERTTFGLAGAGNLHADTAGGGSIDFRIGRRLAECGGDVEAVRDGLEPVESEMFDLLEALAPHSDTVEGDDFPISSAAADIVFGETSLAGAVARLMSHPRERDRA
ncbi:MAG: hypothetical protein ABEL76_06850 [Bradymonadaceae bacterium]